MYVLTTTGGLTLKIYVFVGALQVSRNLDDASEEIPEKRQSKWIGETGRRPPVRNGVGTVVGALSGWWYLFAGCHLHPSERR